MTNYFLKMTASMVVLNIMQAVVPVQAAVNMISVEHRVWGDAGVSPTRNTYDEAGPDPLSRNVTGFSSGYYSSSYRASSSASDWSVNAYRIGDAYYANAYAQNTYIFQPHSREITISLNGVIGVWWFENSAKMTLTKRGAVSTDPPISKYLSPSTNPFGLGQNDMKDYPFSWSDTVVVDPAEEYELIIFVNARRGEGGDGSASLNLSIVPEPGTTLLAGMAALLFCGRRHRPKAAH